MCDPMKGGLLSKSWDDIFPADHPTEFSLTNQSDGYLLEFGNHDTSAGHWRFSSAASEDTTSSQVVSAQPFSLLKEDLRCMQKGFGRKEKYSKNSIHDSLEKDSTQDLIQEIAMLELEVAHLEQHLLALYRKAFDQTLGGLPYVTKEQDIALSSKMYDHQQGQQLAFSKSACTQMTHSSQSYHNQSVAKSKQDNTCNSNHLSDSMDRQITGARTELKKDHYLHSSYSQPISWPQKDEHHFFQVVNDDEEQEVSIKSRESTPLQQRYSEEQPGSPISVSGNPTCKTPNRLSEHLVSCMASIYCKLAEPPLPYPGGLMSPSSSLSASTFSTQRFPRDGWTSQSKRDGSCDVLLSDPSQEISDSESTRASSSTVEVHWICVDNERLTYAARMLRTFRSLVQQLERVDPTQMTHEQKLAFWINIHNALMMHAYLAYGIPRNHLKCLKLLQKAAYKIGAQSINAQTIEQSILRCRWHRPAKWLELILSPASKLRAGERQAYAIDSPEPLLCFALCCGGRSDPTVRVYTEQSIYKELELAKREFLRANVKFREESKVQLPRMLESFARESSVGSAHLLDWICDNVPEKVASSIARCLLKSDAKPHKRIEWLPYDFTFRYVFMSPLSIWIPPALHTQSLTPQPPAFPDSPS